MTPLVVVGDSMLDRDLDGRARRLAPDAPVPVVDDPRERVRAGGAALAATLAARDGRAVTFVTALGADGAGASVAALLRRVGVQLIDLGLTGATPQKVRVWADGHPVVRVDRGAPTQVVAPEPDDVAPLRRSPTILVSDYGRGVAAQAQVRAAIAEAAASGAQVAWDPHPRGATPPPATRVVTPNLAEARRFAGAADHGSSVRAVAAMAADLRDRWRSAGVAVTLGERGALLLGADGTPLMVPAPAPAPALRGALDACGAGDRFAVTVAGALADGAVLSEAIVDGVRSATSFVGAGGVGALDVDPPACDDRGSPRTGAPPVAEVGDVVAAVRARGGTVVATGGCFDLLHAGHVQLLTEARRLGDCLVVCVNSDASVRRRKGPGRPVVCERDRRAVLLGLAAVDAVVSFDEDTPERLLARLRPDIWVKGADYGVADMPEAQQLASWGGQPVVLPYLAGRSTSSIIEEASRHARH